MDFMNTILDLMSKATMLGGAIWLLWGAVALGGGLKDHAGPQIQSGIWQIVGGGLILAAAALFKQVTVGW